MTRLTPAQRREIQRRQARYKSESQDDIDELLAAADRLDARGDRVARHAAASLRRKANGQRFADALDDAGVFTNSALALERDLTTADDTKETNR